MAAPTEVLTRPVPATRTAGAVRVVLVVTGIALVQLLLVLLFAWSASRAAPHDVPLAVAGSPPSTQALTQGLTRARPGAFTVVTVADDAAARSAVTGRTADAAVVFGPSGATVYTASAGGAGLAQVLGEALPAAVRAGRPDTVVTLTDLVPAPRDDPHGAAIPTALIPITITSIAAGAVICLLARNRRSRLAALGVYAVLAGTLSTVALQTVLGALTGPWLADAGVLTLACLAVSATTAGLVALLGPPGAVLSALVVFFFGLPFSGASSAWRLVPTPWGRIAQDLPAGALNQALRSVAFFDGAAAGPALRVLAVWALVGLLACQVLRRRYRAVAAP